MNTKSIRQQYNLTQKEFSVLFDIPYPTVRNWDARNSMPDYVLKLVVQTLYYRKEAFTSHMRYLDDADEAFIGILKDDVETTLKFRNKIAP